MTAKGIILLMLVFFSLPLLTALATGIKRFYTQHLDPRVGVGVVTIKGVLYDSSSLVKQLHELFEEKDVKAILLKIESPGSAAGTGQAIHQELQLLKQEHPKPVIALIENVCASGGYYIASAADHIIATGSSTIGSIGSNMPFFFQLHDFIERYDVHYLPVKAGQYKNTTDPFSKRTDQEVELLQGLVDDVYEQFAADIAKNRKLSLPNRAQWAEGKLFTGRQALKLGLIDELGSATTAIKAIKDKAMIEKGKEIRWVKSQQPSKWSKMFSSSADDQDSIFNRIAGRICSFLESRYAGPMVH